jgi:hypothetical protein
MLATGPAEQGIGLRQQLQGNPWRGSRVCYEIPCIDIFVSSSSSHSPRQASQQGSVTQLPSPGLFHGRQQWLANEAGEQKTGLARDY